MTKVLSWTFGLSLWLSLMLGAIHLSSTQLSFYQHHYARLDVAATLQMSNADLNRVTVELLRYLVAARQDLDLEVSINGQNVPMFNQHEIDHMIDVQVLYVRLVQGFYVSLGVLGLSFVGLFATLKRHAGTELWRGFIQAALVLGALIGGIGLYAALDFRSFWIAFHELLFDNDLWLLNPNTDRLIQMVPESFFTSLITMIFVRFALTVSFVGLSLKGWAHGLNRRWLKWFALAAMSVDHVGYFLFPHYFELRLFGRLAFPIFAFLFAHTLHQKTDLRPLRKLLWSSAILTQVALAWAGVELVNILFLFAISTHAYVFLQKRNIGLFVVCAIALEVAGVDYGLYGLISILWFAQYQDQPLRQSLGFIALTLVFSASRVFQGYGAVDLMQSLLAFSSWGYRVWAQAFAGLAMVLTMHYDATRPPRFAPAWLNKVERYFFYVYYPVHLVALQLMARFL
jgi:integral membrane protein (TIGR01906 family)